ncbi:hypothetical protein [Flavobacterium daemonense]|uniref:hypothetical protein n=1 Tax=Flavobacterium daemonense TaxID=1393049 RepID=UPI00118705D2|nr:hypothetical protein [Flavobacterium daemonense]KAF2327299.1 hypothetical protein FND99_19055 [Flavobacterium daemonense]
MIKNPRLIKTLKIFASGLMLLALLTLTINSIEPNIEFPSVGFNRFWGFLICYSCLISFLIVILVFKSFNKIAKRILLIIGIPTVFIALLFTLIMSLKLEYQPRFDRYIAYRNVYQPNQYVFVQDYVKWKTNQPAVDTTFIKNLYFLRKAKHIDSMKIKGKWIKFDENGKIIDTVFIK